MILFLIKKCSKTLSYFVKNETNETYLSNLASSFKKNFIDWFSHSPVKVFEESKCIWWARLNKNFGKKVEFKSIREKIQAWSISWKLKIYNA